MASTTFALDVAGRSLEEDGFFDLNDSTVGDHILEMEKRGFPYLTEYGLDFCKRFAFDERIRLIVESSLGSCRLGHWLRYERFSGHIECFRTGGLEAGRHVLAVHLWAKGSQVYYYLGSHLHNLRTTPGLRSLYEISQSELDRVGSRPEVKVFPDGGMVIFDARLCFQIEQGYAITFQFATDEVIENWVEMTLPHSETLKHKIGELENLSEKIGLNFVFKKDGGRAGK